jgi:hypothetical protein
MNRDLLYCLEDFDSEEIARIRDFLDLGFSFDKSVSMLPSRVQNDALADALADPEGEVG